MDADEAPAVERPAPVEEVLPPERHGRHFGIGFELVLDTAVPQLGREVVKVPMGVSRNRLLRMFLRQQQVTVQEIPAVRASRSRGEEERVRQRTVEQIVDTRRVRVAEQTVDVPDLGGTSCTAARWLDDAEVLVGVCFSALFPRGKKCEIWAAVECEPAVALELVHPSGL